MAKALQLGLSTKTDKEKLALKLEKARATYPFANISPDLILRYNARAKRMALRVDMHKRCVYLTLPKRSSLRAAYLFTYEHRHWIREKIAEMPVTINYEHGAKLDILGQSRQIEIDFDPTYRRTDIKLNADTLNVRTNKDDPSKRIRRFLIDHAKAELSALSHEKALKTGRKIQKIDVKDTTSRWGSCSHDAQLSYSWRLLFAPPEAFDYVVAHEVAHLKHLDHSPAFWHLCEELSKDYSAGKRWMKRNSQKLIQYS